VRKSGRDAAVSIRKTRPRESRYMGGSPRRDKKVLSATHRAGAITVSQQKNPTRAGLDSNAPLLHQHFQMTENSIPSHIRGGCPVMTSPLCRDLSWVLERRLFSTGRS